MPVLSQMLRFGIRNTFGLLAYRLPHGPHVTRYQMYAHFRSVFAGWKWDANLRCLSISGSSELCNVIGIPADRLVEVDYPDYTLLDMRQFGDGEFDVVVSDQVIEHLEGDPHQAFAETLRLLKPGGLAIHTTCFINHIHWGPSDYWRFTPDALKYLAKDFSQIVDAGGWGNRLVWLVDWAGLRTAPVPHAKWHPLHRVATLDETDWPIVTWVIARK